MEEGTGARGKRSRRPSRDLNWYTVEAAVIFIMGIAAGVLIGFIGARWPL
jgi:NhaP-type Na+/H+ or K+/H+ antiporter